MPILFISAISLLRGGTVGIMELSIGIKILCSLLIVSFWLLLIWLFYPFKQSNKSKLPKLDNKTLNALLNKGNEDPFYIPDPPKKTSYCQDPNVIAAKHRVFYPWRF